MTLTDRPHGDPTTSWTVIAGILGALGVFVIVLGLQVLFYAVERAEHQRKVIEQPYDEVRRIRAQQEQGLHSYRWVDKNAGIVGIPIDRAMALVVEELATYPEGRPEPATERAANSADVREATQP